MLLIIILSECLQTTSGSTSLTIFTFRKKTGSFTTSTTTTTEQPTMTREKSVENAVQTGTLQISRRTLNRTLEQ